MRIVAEEKIDDESHNPIIGFRIGNGTNSLEWNEIPELVVTPITSPNPRAEQSHGAMSVLEGLGDLKPQSILKRNGS